MDASITLVSGYDRVVRAHLEDSSYRQKTSDIWRRFSMTIRLKLMLPRIVLITVLSAELKALATYLLRIQLLH